ncbi:MAG: lipopolysaccharide heptosyltransferase II [Candidatus Hydrogenedentes bacterium]|jgi:heptosyltransferase-2|nr:lipopolysaccharide heptosyltransferase II [Candidatus Hydrogenedentota bacterium]
MPWDPKSVIAVVPNWLGDVAMCTPALRALRNRYPKARLSCVGRRPACDLLRGISWIDELVEMPHRPRPLALLKHGVDLRHRRPDIAVLFPHSFRAAFVARLAGAATRVGYARDGRTALLTHRVQPHRVDGKVTPVYMACEYLDLVRKFGCEDDGRGLELATDAMAVARVKEHLVGPSPVVGFAPGAAFGPSKQWPAERFADVADKIHEATGAQCVLLTGPGERDTHENVLNSASCPFATCDEGRPTIDSLKATISQLDLLVCNDSGPRHVAVAFDIPTICVMGSTAPAYSEGPYERGEVIRIDVDCGPCQKPVCAEDHRCMTGISAERVAQAAMTYLPKPRV